LIHLNAHVVKLWQYFSKLKEMSVTTSTLFVIIAGVLAFAAFSASLAWAQLRTHSATVPIVHRKRRF